MPLSTPEYSLLQGELPVMQLEAAATLGVVVILAVLGIIVQTSIHAGLPAIRSGELPLWTFQVRLSPVHKPLCAT